VETVAQEPLVLALEEKHPLAKLAAIPIRALQDEPMVMARDARHRQWVTDLCRAHGFEPKIGQFAGEMVAGIVMAFNGFGVQIVPESATALMIAGLTFRPLKSSAPAFKTIDLQCAYLRNERSPLLKGLLTAVHDYRKNRTAKPGRKAPRPNGTRGSHRRR